LRIRDRLPRRRCYSASRATGSRGPGRRGIGSPDQLHGKPMGPGRRRRLAEEAPASNIIGGDYHCDKSGGVRLPVSRRLRLPSVRPPPPWPWSNRDAPAAARRMPVRPLRTTSKPRAISIHRDSCCTAVPRKPDPPPGPGRLKPKLHGGPVKRPPHAALLSPAPCRPGPRPLVAHGQSLPKFQLAALTGAVRRSQRRGISLERPGSVPRLPLCVWPSVLAPH